MSQQINLYNPNYLKHKPFSAQAMAWALALLAFGLLAFYGYARAQVTRLQAEAAHTAQRLATEETQMGRLAQQFGARPKNEELEVKIQQAEAELKALDEVHAVLNRDEVNARGFSPYLIALARQAMDGLWLTGFSVVDGEMEISGRTLKPELLPVYIRRLGEEPVMLGRTFAMLDMHQADAPAATDGKPGTRLRYVEFTLQSTYQEAAQ